jgi:hypothetical protein
MMGKDGRQLVAVTIVAPDFNGLFREQSESEHRRNNQCHLGCGAELQQPGFSLADFIVGHVT